MTSIVAALERHRAGQLAEARSMYLAILATEPNNVDALHLLGVAERQSGRPDAAISLIRRAIEIRGNVAEFHGNLGTALLGSGETDAAIAAFRRALALRPTLFEAALGLGNALALSNRAAEAVEAYRIAMALAPKDPTPVVRLGMALTTLERRDEAIASFRHALRVSPDDADGNYELATALLVREEWPEAITYYRKAIDVRPRHAESHYNLGIALLRDGQTAAAETAFRGALAARPDYVEAMINLGRTLDELSRLEEALAAYDAALALDPAWPDAHFNRGVTLRKLSSFSDAIASYHRALDLDPRHVRAQYSLGAVLADIGHSAEALAHYDAAIAVDPDHAYAHLNKAVAHLLRGELEIGWREYEWRWKIPGCPERQCAAPPWRGESLSGRTILLHAEQGFGDSIQFMRYVPLIASKADHVVLEIQPELERLAQTLDGAVEIVARGRDLPDVDCHAPLLGLPRLLGTSLASVPADVPYLWPDERSVCEWRDRIPNGPGLNVGIVWAGNPKHKNDANRSIDVASFAIALAVDGIRFHSLQLVGRGAFPDGVNDLSPWLLDFAETAAALVNLDLVVTVDTSVAHLAGALGVPVWVLLPFVPDWRWLTDRDDSPWYPSMRLFRQERQGDWRDVLAHVADELERLTIGPRVVDRTGHLGAAVAV